MPNLTLNISPVIKSQICALPSQYQRKFEISRYFFSAVVTAILLCIFVLATNVCQIIGLNGLETLQNADYYLDFVEQRVSDFSKKLKMKIEFSGCSYCDGLNYKCFGCSDSCISRSTSIPTHWPNNEKYDHLWGMIFALYTYVFFMSHNFWLIKYIKRKSYLISGHIFHNQANV